ncbi:nuclear pore complex protein Nup50-like [Prorops nasuta]|uniref:nuclear pore complex protein Nup50-like n=1 Tax=Prorops nasuta TaxID=863751 RepID=UPI0034D00CB4
MTSKRSAPSELNQDNWHKEEIPEEVGTFARASDDEIQKRVIRFGKRRITGPTGGDSNVKNVFKSLASFNSTPATNSNFNFLSNTSTSNNASSSNIFKTNASNGTTTTNENGGEKLENTKASLSSSTVSTQKSEPKEDKIFKKSSDYFAKLKGLNESVAQWIKTHVDENPFCILTPIFRDYERYLKDIESENNKSNSASNSLGTSKSLLGSKEVEEVTKLDGTLDNKDSTKESIKPVTDTEKKSEQSIFSNVNTSASIFANLDKGPAASTKSIFSTEQKSDQSKSIFGNTEAKSIFGNVSSEQNPFFKKTDAKEADAKTENKAPIFSMARSATFSFGQSSSANTTAAGFSFGGNKPFTFGAQAVKPPETEEKNEHEDEDDEPPKPDFKPVTEEGAVYEQRCKVFVKKDASFSERGIGNLFLKPTPNGKTQLIVRADTALGNILLNTLLTESIPTKRMNKNTVMIVCLPMPDSNPPPTPILLRVKTEEQADELMETLDKHKK